MKSHGDAENRKSRTMGPGRAARGGRRSLSVADDWNDEPGIVIDEFGEHWGAADSHTRSARRRVERYLERRERDASSGDPFDDESRASAARLALRKRRRTLRRERPLED